MKVSCVQVYTGDGKGKTTAAMGLAMRAAGRGLSVKIVQFLKGRDTGETSVIDKIDEIELLRISAGNKFYCDMTDDEKTGLRERVRGALPHIEDWLGHADLLILDEAMAALSCGILTLDEALHIIENRDGTEVVLTGRDAPAEILEKAQLVTEMREIKHYMHTGVQARKGIEF